MARTGRGNIGTGREGMTEAAGSVDEEVAHVRARFAVDPATPASLADAWTAPTGTVEEDESELIDAVADCLSVGLPLDAAVASWRAGSLQISDHDDEGDDEETDVYRRGDDERTDVYDPRRSATRRRVET